MCGAVHFFRAERRAHAEGIVSDFCFFAHATGRGGTIRWTIMHLKESHARRAKKTTDGLMWPEKFPTAQPTKAVAAALGTGFLLNLLPIGKIVGMLTEAAISLARPL